jgi:deazaflavin-dependent oxidoreductase (nitroreductase family)
MRSYAEANPIQRRLRAFVASGPGSRVAAPLLHRLDGSVFRATRGKHTLSSLASGLPVVFLTTTGARSGRPRTVPLLGVPTSEGLAVIASNFGQDRHPAWYHNLRAHPEGEVLVDGSRWRCRAVEAEGERRARIWDEGLKLYPGWTTYERRAENRRIVVFVLEPLDEAPGSSQ